MLSQQISNDLKQAMKDKDIVRVSTLRMLIAAIRNKEITLFKKEEGLSDEEIIQVLRTEVRKREEASGGFQKGGRMDMAEQERREAKILGRYLPAELSQEELRGIVKDAIGAAQAVSEKDFSKVMKAAQMVINGRVSGERVAEMVRGELRGNAS